MVVPSMKLQWGDMGRGRERERERACHYRAHQSLAQTLQTIHQETHLEPIPKFQQFLIDFVRHPTMLRHFYPPKNTAAPTSASPPRRGAPPRCAQRGP